MCDLKVWLEIKNIKSKKTIFFRIMIYKNPSS